MNKKNVISYQIRMMLYILE